MVSEPLLADVAGAVVAGDSRFSPGVLWLVCPCEGLSRVPCLRRAGGVGTWVEAGGRAFPKLWATDSGV